MSTLAAASTAASSSSTSSPRCVPFAFRRGGALGRLRQAPAAATGGAPGTTAGGCGRPLCCAAEVIGEGIQNAFFVSLDRCSCVKVRTDSFKESESDAAPLMSPLPLPSPPPHDDSGAAAARSGRKRRASAGGKPRRGLGCWTPSSTSVN